MNNWEGMVLRLITHKAKSILKTVVFISKFCQYRFICLKYLRDFIKLLLWRCYFLWNTRKIVLVHDLSLIIINRKLLHRNNLTKFMVEISELIKTHFAYWCAISLPNHTLVENAWKPDFSVHTEVYHCAPQGMKTRWIGSRKT